MKPFYVLTLRRAVALSGVLGSGLAGASLCTLTPADVVLGTYNPLGTLDTLGGGSVTVSCIKTLGDVLGSSVTVPFTLSLSGTSSATTPRLLYGPLSSTLNLYVYTSLPAGTGKVWGTGAGGTEVMNGQAILPAIATLLSALPVVQAIPYQLKLPARQLVRPGPYIGTMTVTLTF